MGVENSIPGGGRIDDPDKARKIAHVTHRSRSFASEARAEIKGRRGKVYQNEKSAEFYDADAESMEGAAERASDLSLEELESETVRLTQLLDDALVQQEALNKRVKELSGEKHVFNKVLKFRKSGIEED